MPWRRRARGPRARRALDAEVAVLVRTSGRRGRLMCVAVEPRQLIGQATSEDVLASQPPAASVAVGCRLGGLLVHRERTHLEVSEFACLSVGKHVPD